MSTLTVAQYFGCLLRGRKEKHLNANMFHSLGYIKKKARELQLGAGGWSTMLCKRKKLPSLIFLCLGSSFIGLPNHLSTYSAVLIGKKKRQNQFEVRISSVHLIKCFASPLGGERPTTIMMQTQISLVISWQTPATSIPPSDRPLSPTFFLLCCPHFLGSPLGTYLTLTQGS